MLYLYCQVASWNLIVKHLVAVLIAGSVLLPSALAQEPAADPDAPKIKFEIERETEGKRQRLTFSAFERQAERLDEEIEDSEAETPSKVRYLTEAEWAALQEELAADETEDGTAPD